MKKYSVYVIKSANGRFYTGLTEDVEKRLKDHNEGISKWTSKHKNWTLIHKEEYNTLGEALKREKFIKKQKGGDGFFKIINKLRDAG